MSWKMLLKDAKLHTPEEGIPESLPGINSPKQAQSRVT